MKQTFSPSELSDLPLSPGVYYFYNQQGDVLYVGKATVLKSRVSSYWQRPQDRYVFQALKDVTEIHIEPTATALEALILEANEIMRLQPPFNILQKDDKRFASIIVTREQYPQVLVVRATDERKFPVKYSFGPYQSARSARLALKVLRRIFPYRCSKPVGSGRACDYYHLDLCPGTCLASVNEERYQETIQRLVQFLSGKRTSVVRSIKLAMKTASKNRSYEDAAKLRDQLFALEHIHDIAFMTNDEETTIAQFPIKRIEAYDISLAAGRDAVGSMVVLRYGIPDKNEYRLFHVKTIKGTDDVAMLREVLTRRMAHSEWQLPDLFAIDGGIPQRNAAVRALRDSGVTSPAVVGVTKGPDRKRADVLFTAAAERIVRHMGVSNAELETVMRRARDEAHRFAISFHRRTRSKRLLGN